MCLGIPGQIIGIDDAENAIATVDVCGVRRRINIACILDAEHGATDRVGDWVLVHVGFAMSRIDAQEAAETLRILQELAELKDEVAAMQTGRSTMGAAE